MDPLISHGIIEAQELLRKHGASLERIEMTRPTLDKLAAEVGAVYSTQTEKDPVIRFLGVEIVVHE